MKKLLTYLIPALLLTGLLGGIALKLKKNKSIAGQRVYHYEPAPSADSVAEAMPPAVQKAAGQRLFTGMFEASRETKISAELQGKINRIDVDAGSIVSKGQRLIQLDDALLRLQLQAADVQIEGLTADVNRYTVLAKADAIQGVQLEKAQLGLKSAQIQRATIQEQLDKTLIKAPFSGVVYAKLNEVGGFAAPGVPLVQLMDMAQMRFTIQVPESELKYFSLGQSHDIVADAFPDKKLKGSVSLIASKANPGNSFPVQFSVSNFATYSLRAGMFGKIELSVKE